MAENNDAANMMADAMKIHKALFFDLPLAGMQQSMGPHTEKETITSAWSGYDAMVKVASRSIDNLYRTPQFAEATARSLEGFLRWQQVGNGVTKTVLTGLTQAADLPSAKDTKGLQAEVRALREEISVLRGAAELRAVSTKGERHSQQLKPVAA